MCAGRDAACQAGAVISCNRQRVAGETMVNPCRFYSSELQGDTEQGMPYPAARILTPSTRDCGMSTERMLWGQTWRALEIHAKCFSPSPQQINSFYSEDPLASLGAVRRVPDQTEDSLQRGDCPAGEHSASISQDH